MLKASFIAAAACVAVAAGSIQADAQTTTVSDGSSAAAVVKQVAPATDGRRAAPVSTGGRSSVTDRAANGVGRNSK